jgi:hypothetical protein
LPKIWDRSSSGQRDCYYYENEGDAHNLDLLDAMQIIGFWNSDDSQPIYYVVDNVKRLSQLIASDLTKQHLKFRADSACHLSAGLDLLSGYIWPLSQSWQQPDGKENRADLSAWSDQMSKAGRLLIVNQGKVAVVEVPNLRNQTVTGGDVSPCTPALVGSNITWECFVGYEPNKVPTEFGYNYYKKWTISRSGKILGVTERKERSDIK